MLLPLETNDLRTPGLLYQQKDFGFFCTSKSPYRLNSNYIIRISLITLDTKLNETRMMSKLDNLFTPETPG